MFQKQLSADWVEKNYEYDNLGFIGKTSKMETRQNKQHQPWMK